MYVREKKIRRGDKTYSYWQVVQGTRVDGKVRQTVVAYVGPAEDRQQADAHARMRGLLCGVKGCGQAGAVKFPSRIPLRVPGCEVDPEWFVCDDHFAAYQRGEGIQGWTLWPLEWPFGGRV